MNPFETDQIYRTAVRQLGSRSEGSQDGRGCPRNDDRQIPRGKADRLLVDRPAYGYYGYQEADWLTVMGKLELSLEAAKRQRRKWTMEAVAASRKV